MKNITLEMSLKPFKSLEKENIRKVCENVFEQWKPLLKHGNAVSIMLWTSDGSEILDYRGNEDDEFEWAYRIGGANNTEGEHKDVDPRGTGLHTTNYLYAENPPVITYKMLKSIIKELKETGTRLTDGKKIRVGATFDPGPEFAKSSFKYERHPEICMGKEMGHAMVCSYAKLKADNVSYAGFPDGIPEGLPIGTFLGRQAYLFVKNMDFDYIWLSNGFGFGRDTWSATGAVFDGEDVKFDELDKIKNDVNDFWDYFRAEFKDYPVETRGTNMSMGIDLAADGVPLKEIYNGGYNILPPPNSPWAAIDGDYGLELMGYMSRIAYIPTEDYMFRFYLHDIWWMNSPWYDRYNSLPHDIYLPMAIGRIDENGNMMPPTNFNILSIDNSLGDMPESCVNEPIPHFIKGIKEMPDEPSPVVWVYPFDEYSDADSKQKLKQMYSEDWFIRGAINNGFPLSSVTTTANFIKQDKNIYKASVLVTPVPYANSEFENEIISYVKKGGRVIFYGSTDLAGRKFTELTGVTKGAEISGELDIFIDGKRCGTILHEDKICGGKIGTYAAKNVFAKAGNCAIGIKGDNFVWLRGTVSSAVSETASRPVQHNEEEYFLSETLMIKALSYFKTDIIYEKELSQPRPVMTLHRFDNAFIFSIFSPSTTVKTKIKMPYGAPILDAYETKLEDGYSTYYFPKAEHKECRVFVEQESGIVSCSELAPVSCEYRRRVIVKGLKNATVRFLGESYCKDRVCGVLNSFSDFYEVGDNFEFETKVIDGITFYEAENVTGELVLSMPFDKKFKK